MLHRLALTLLTIFFPPATVLLLTGPYADTLINCVLFLCGVLPSHIHAFYISCTYFHRKRKVKKGKYPGGPKPLIFDEKVWNGGADKVEVEALRRGEGKRKRRSRSVGVGGYRGGTDEMEGRRRSRSVGIGGYEEGGAMVERRASGRSQGLGGGGGAARYY